jgi:amino acid adenylation domain-containing protein
MGSVIGVPIPDLRIYLVDEDLKPVPAGVPGEICVGGAGVARGYLNRPDLTARRFLPDPFSDDAGARLYRSGDLAQINANGEMEYLGRMDHQVKIRGFRVELGEIESALNRHPAIRESVVVTQDTNVGDKRLVAYIVPVQDTPSVTELRQHLMQKLPDYMVPAVFVFLKALPLTTNGKVDRRALPSPNHARPDLKIDFLAPRTEKENALAHIWSEVLEVDQVGVLDNFFELGGDSIRSITILSRAEAAGIFLTLQDIFDYPTIAQLAACEARAKNKNLPAPGMSDLLSADDRALLPGDADDAYPIAALQLGMFFSNEMDPASAMYHDVFSYRIQAAFDLSRMRSVLSHLAQRHPLLRTSFHLAGFSQPLQIVHSAVEVPCTVEDLTGHHEAKQDQLLVEWIELEKRRPFERTVAPLVRFHAQIRNERCFQLIISFHHACLDGWSLAVVMTEICQEYASLLRNEQIQIPAPRISYRDFVQLERGSASSPETRTFWAKKLEGATPQRLPRWPRHLRQGGHEQKRGPEVAIEATVLEGLKALARLAGVPLKTVLLSAHQRVMSLMHGQNDVISGLICNGRPEELDGEKLVGLFLNNLPLRMRLGRGTWLELVQQTFAAERELVPHRRFPLAEIKKLAGGEQLFETAFDFVHFHVYKQLQAGGGLDLAEGHYFEANSLTTYTTFLLDISSSRLELHIDYDPNELCQAQIERMNGYYLNTLRTMATEPSGRYDTFCPLSTDERNQMLLDLNATTQQLPSSPRIAGLFASRVRETPKAIAVTCGDTTLSYEQLDQRAELVAQTLLGLGLQDEELVGICIDRSPEMVAGLLGILKAGGAYVPLDPAYPRERLAFMIQDSKIRLLLTQRAVLASLPVGSAQALCVEDLLADGSAPRTASSPLPGPSNRKLPDFSPLAYVIYTSGSTGKPKGVLVNQKGVVNLLLSAAKTAHITSEDHLLAVTTLSFDIAALEIFMPLITGGRLTLATREEAADGSRLAGLMAASAPTVMQATPATWRLLIETEWKGDQRLKIFCGGEALKRELADELLSRALEVWNFYGPTETTIWSSAWRVVPGESVLIGRPLANTRFYILDPELRPVPTGAIGELHIGGVGLARGYLHRSELTAEKFIADPFSQNQSARLYKTGDLARFLPDGNVECLGRIDHQVKIRGFRVETGEVETILRQHPGIADAIVTTRPDSLGEQRMVGYLISRNGTLANAELRDFARTRLPLYMVPSQFVFLKQFPLTPNGKVDVRNLPAPGDALQTTSASVTPRNPNEQRLADIWQEVLMLNGVGIDDDFFDLGGDSLTATRAFARTNQAFGTALTLREMLDHPTIRTLSDVIARSPNALPALPPILPRRMRPIMPVDK